MFLLFYLQILNFVHKTNKHSVCCVKTKKKNTILFSSAFEI